MRRGENKVKVKWIEFENIATGLKIERINFFDDITLLVGLSGAGKSKILDAIHYSLSLALGKIKPKDIYPSKAVFAFNIDGDDYIWAYEIRKHNIKNHIVFSESQECHFAYESLICNNDVIFERKNGIIKMNEFDEIPTPQKNKSLIYQYSEDSSFEKIVENLLKLYHIDIEMDIRGGLDSEQFEDIKSKVNSLIRRDKTIDITVFSHLPSLIKLYIAKKHYENEYEKIIFAIQDVFPEIEAINVIKDHNHDMYCVEVTTYGTKLHQRDISNGMLKTIYYIIELYTTSKNSLIMIDEFENGLGMNCIDPVSELIKIERPDLQFIITSHHPKIIGNFDYKCWKIIEREEFLVRNFDCNDEGYDLGRNRHDAYYNLMNKWKYEGKI